MRGTSKLVPGEGWGPQILNSQKNSTSNPKFYPQIPNFLPCLKSQIPNYFTPQIPNNFTPQIPKYHKTAPHSGDIALPLLLHVLNLLEPLVNWLIHPVESTPAMLLTIFALFVLIRKIR